MEDLARWLGEQLDAEAEEARLTADAFGAVWTNNDAMESVSSDTGADVVSESYTPRSFIADHDPARVLREIDAKRQIVDAYLPPGSDPHPGLPCINYEGQRPIHYDDTEACWRHLESSKRLLHHDYVLRLLAAVYADRPGYREDWRP